MHSTHTMRIVYFHTSLAPCGPTNQFKTLVKYQSENVEKYYFLFKSSHSSLIPFATRLSLFNLLKLLLSKNITIFHSSGILPDLCLYLLSLFFPQHSYFCTIRNIPWIDYLSLYPKYVSTILIFIHLNILSSSRLIPICCSLPTLSAIKSRLPSCLYFVDNCYTGNLISPLSVNNNLSSSNSLRCLSLSPLIPRKRIDSMISSFSGFQHYHTLDICGDGPLLKSLKCLNSSPSISFLGHVNPTCNFFSRFDLFLSFSESEGLPNSVLEALYNGLVCILSPIPSHKYLQRFTDRIIILEDLSPDSLRLAFDQAHSSSYSERLHYSFRKYFHPSRMLSSYMNIYTKHHQ